MTRASPARGRAAAALLAAALVAACRGPALPEWQPSPAPASLEALERAAELVDGGEPEAARALLLEVEEVGPPSFAVAAALQDVEERLLDLGWAPAGFAATSGTPSERLRRVYRARALESGEARAYVMAARAEDDGLAALHLLDEALARDADDATAHYGRAHALFGLGRLGAARDALDRAFELEPGHVAARRLETLLLAALGREEEAFVHLEAWLARTAGDELSRPDERVDAWLDLAALGLSLGRSPEALAALVEAEASPSLVGARAVRAELLRAVTLDAAGRPREALDAARRAAELDPDGALALVYAALLHDRRLGDPEAARLAWLAVIERVSASDGTFDPSDALLLLRARVELASLERGGQGRRRVWNR